MTRASLRLLAIEAAASAFTITGLWLGSTTFGGAACYLVGLVFWFWFTFARRAWGLMPLNVATTVVIVRNLLGLLS